MTTTTVVLNLGPSSSMQTTASLFVGREHGVRLRQELNLDALDEQTETKVEINFPTNTFAVTSSFVAGLLMPSIRKFPSKDAFAAKFQFNHGDPSVLAQIDEVRYYHELFHRAYLTHAVTSSREKLQGFVTKMFSGLRKAA